MLQWNVTENVRFFFGMNPQLKGHYRQKKNGNAKVKELT